MKGRNPIILAVLKLAVDQARLASLYSVNMRRYRWSAIDSCPFFLILWLKLLVAVHRNRCKPSRYENVRCVTITPPPPKTWILLIFIVAVSLARLNSELLGLADRVSFSIAKWEEDGAIGLSSLNTTKYDILVSNPPYIPTSEISDLAPEIVR